MLPTVIQTLSVLSSDIIWVYYNSIMLVLSSFLFFIFSFCPIHGLGLNCPRKLFFVPERSACIFLPRLLLTGDTQFGPSKNVQAWIAVGSYWRTDCKKELVWIIVSTTYIAI